MEHLELPNILTMAQELRGDDVYGLEGKYPEVLKKLDK